MDSSIITRLTRIEELLETIAQKLNGPIHTNMEDEGSVVDSNETVTAEDEPYVFNKEDLYSMHLRDYGYSLGERDDEKRQIALNTAIQNETIEKVFLHLQALHSVWSKNLMNNIYNSSNYVSALEDDLKYLKTKYV